MKIGVSVSEKQGRTDWSRVKEAGIDYAMLCCGHNVGDRMQEDQFFRINADACMEYKLPFGTYFYSRASDLDRGKEEAEYTLKILEEYSPEYPVMLRLEDCDTTLTLKRGVIGDIAQFYCEAIRQAGHVPGIYANKYWFTNILTDTRFDNWTRWVMQHYKECTYSGAYHMWQYTSGARITGIQGLVELSECYIDGSGGDRAYKNGLPDLTGYVGVSLVGALNAEGYPSDFSYRGDVAANTGLVSRKTDYKGTAEQNLKLLRRLGGTVSSSKMLREGTYIKLKLGSRNINTGVLFGDEVYGNTYQVISISGISVIFGIRGVVIGKVNRNSVMVV